MKLKRVVSILLTLCILAALLPGTEVFAMEGRKDLWINGQRVTEENNTVVCGNGMATVVFPAVEDEMSEYLLILDNATITKADSSYSFLQAGIYIYKKLRIELRGSNSIGTPDTDRWDNRGIYAEMLTICGNGTLTVRSGAASQSSTAIYSDGKVFIHDGADITAIGGKAPRSYGIEARGSTQSIEYSGYGKLVAYGEKAALNTLVWCSINYGDCAYYSGNSAPGTAGVREDARYQAFVRKLPYKDVEHTQWYYTSVFYCNKNKLMTGTAADRFSPDTPTSRAMLVTVLHRLSETPEPTGEVLFSDVAAGKWYTEAVGWAAENEIVNGVGDGRFDPDGNITREQLAAIVYRYCQAMGIDSTQRKDLSAFSDHSQVSPWAQEAMQWAVAAGLINGSDGKLMPQGNATRAQVAAILMRFVQNNFQ